MNKATYQPREIVECAVTGVPADTVSLCVTLLHIHEEIDVRTLAVTDTEIIVCMSLPGNDFTGYLLRIEALNVKNALLATAFNAVDCSSDWTRFPRYGYVWDFTSGTDTEAKIDRLTRYHINGLQFYDWQYRHHMPVAPDTTGWKDWSSRAIDGHMLRRYIAAAHTRGMVCMAYNMVYAANRTYPYDGSGVDKAWRLVKADGSDFTCEMDASRGDIGVLQYFNPLHPGWQRYIFTRENEVFDTFAFDGWHGDTIGECGRMTTTGGEPLGHTQDGKPIYLVKDCYTTFLNAAKQAIGKHYLSFNPVGAQGIENVNVSDVDVLYAEFWPWEKDADGTLYAQYATLQRAIFEAAKQSGGKSLVVAAYVNYRNPSAQFNAPAVRLLDAVVFASGGARIELGNGNGMLSDEYFPADSHKRMDETLRNDVIRLYDFAVAYENLLRDGQTPLQHEVTVEGYPVSADGHANTVWCFAMADNRYEVFHFINLTGTDSGWRDEEQTKPAPTLLANLQVKLYTNYPAAAVCLVSPDSEDPSVHELPFTTGEDDRGVYIAFAMPSLAYWNMIFLR
ncbi:MAG: glycoside hydrolase family 66 protein [Eubacteriales bacterium]|nr:glycoside hydrolase family 66 protein [Eubacteriales bacterium]